MVEAESRIVDLESSCSSCGSGRVVRDYELGKAVCGNCGKVIREGIMDRGPEWREYSQEEREKRNRQGSPTTLTIHDKGLSTQIDRKNRDAKGNNLSPSKRALMYRLRKWHRRSRVSGSMERNLTTALSEIDRMASQLGLPRKVRESASKFYREAVKKDLIRGHSIESVTSGALYAACRENQIPRTLDEIAEVSQAERIDIGKNYRLLTRELDIYLPPVDPTRFIARFGSELEISNKTRRKAIELIKEAKEKKLSSGKSPVGIAAATLYMAGIMEGEKRSQREVAEVAKVTGVTVRKRYQEIAEELGIELNP